MSNRDLSRRRELRRWWRSSHKTRQALLVGVLSLLVVVISAYLAGHTATASFQPGFWQPVRAAAAGN